jgi:2-polyprenyl-6-methoxyphenol hydroxylase-like FAD-dependent oxidoreductase|tara:strand:+ start:33 stop:1175 length:1143 start_codon:yes stop_codon:yes gene_type:complete
MKEQKICIVGDGLAGLITAVTLRNLDIRVDLYCKKENFSKKKTIDNRVTAISEANLEFLTKQIGSKSKAFFWPSKQIKLFYENKGKYLNFLNFDETKKELMLIFENYKLKNYLIKIIKKSKNINLINEQFNNINVEKNILDLKNFKMGYDLIILCLGKNSKHYDVIGSNRAIAPKSFEVAFSGKVKHDLKNLSVSQYFLKEGPLAILPFKQNELSFVWSIEKKFHHKDLKKMSIMIIDKLKEILNIKIKISNLQFFPIQLNLKKKYYKKNLLILGEGIHSVHPIAGQGFNLILRDVKKLYELLSKNMQLGLQIKNSYILKEFVESRKTENILFGVGIEITNAFFKIKKYSAIKNLIIKNVSQIKIIKKLSQKISNKGLDF